MGTEIARTETPNATQSHRGKSSFNARDVVTLNVMYLADLALACTGARPSYSGQPLR